eukprot:11023515-Heterocapsa_arctica.AAC.1
MATLGTVAKTRAATPKGQHGGRQPQAPPPAPGYDETVLRQWYLTDRDWARFDGPTRPIFTWADA